MTGTLVTQVTSPVGRSISKRVPYFLHVQQHSSSEKEAMRGCVEMSGIQEDSCSTPCAKFDPRLGFPADWMTVLVFSGRRSNAQKLDSTSECTHFT